MSAASAKKNPPERAFLAFNSYHQPGLSAFGTSFGPPAVPAFPVLLEATTVVSLITVPLLMSATRGTPTSLSAARVRDRARSALAGTFTPAAGSDSDDLTANAG
jgi:hypothetical protein